MNVIYIQTSELTEEYTQAARKADFNSFNQKYFSADVFLLDDVQYLERKEKTTDTVFDIFNRLHSNNKQVVLSADRKPNEIDLHERFLSRFNSGLLADIQPPSFETKVTIFSHYLEYCSRRFNREDILSFIRPDVIEFIISLSGSNIRELKGAATNLAWTLISEHKSRFLPVTIEEAETIVSSHFKRLDKKEVDIATIQK
jgi:chromosomal replication initiator protein